MRQTDTLMPSKSIRVPESEGKLDISNLVRPLDKPPEIRRAVAAQPLKLPKPDFNGLVMDSIKGMPKGGGYAITSSANDGLRKSVTISGTKLDFKPQLAMPSYCSGATYQVFLSAVQAACEKKKIKMGEEALRALPVAGQPDGVGIWGRWNANGPGTARLFHEAGLGVNFDDLNAARPGDFLKIFWNDHIGKREFGHSVVFLGVDNNSKGEPQVRFWSSNQPDGYGEKSVPLTKIKRMLFSRLTDPTALAKLPKLGPDAYLKDMLKRDGTPEEMAEKTQLRTAPR